MAAFSDDGGNVCISFVGYDALRIIIHGVFHLLDYILHIRHLRHSGKDLFIPLEQLDGIESPLSLRNIASQQGFNVPEGSLYLFPIAVNRCSSMTVLRESHSLFSRIRDSVALKSGNFNYVAAKLLCEGFRVDPIPVFLHNIHHIDSHDNRNSQLHQLCGQIEVSLQVCSVNNIDDGIRPFCQQIVSGHDLFQRIWRQRVDTRKVCNNNILLSLQPSFLFFHRNSRPVSHKLVGAGQSIKQCCLAAVWVSGKCNFY